MSTLSVTFPEYRSFFLLLFTQKKINIPKFKQYITQDDTFGAINGEQKLILFNAIEADYNTLDDIKDIIFSDSTIEFIHNIRTRMATTYPITHAETIMQLLRLVININNAMSLTFWKDVLGNTENSSLTSHEAVFY